MQIAKKVIDGDTLTFRWADDSETVIKPSDFSEEIIAHAILHGLSQKLGDSYSGAGGDVDAAKAMFEETRAALAEGDWNRKGGGFSTGGIWVEALAKAANVSMEEALEAWNNQDDAGKAGIRKQPQVKAAKAEIELERAQKKAADAAPFELPTS